MAESPAYRLRDFQKSREYSLLNYCGVYKTQRPLENAFYGREYEIALVEKRRKAGFVYHFLH